MKPTFRSQRKLHILLTTIGIAILVGLFYLLAKLGIGIPCLFNKFTGLQCPGCGNSRAALSLMGLDFRSALQFNLLFPLEFGYILWVYCACCIRYLQGKAFSYRPRHLWPDICILIIVILWGIIRNII